MRTLGPAQGRPRAAPPEWEIYVKIKILKASTAEELEIKVNELVAHVRGDWEIRGNIFIHDGWWCIYLQSFQDPFEDLA